MPQPALCPVCRSQAPWIFRHKVLVSSPADMHLCPDCDYMFLAQPGWLADAYQRVINAMDTGSLARAVNLRNATTLPIHLMSGPSASWLDYGGGHGVYARLMRDTGFNFYWQDPLAENLFSIGFEETPGAKFRGVTCFECFEHFPDPRAELGKMLERAPRILFSTELRPQTIPDPQAWHYYGWEHGQHVGFHSEKSLRTLGRLFGLAWVSSGDWLHAFLPEGEENSLSARLIRRGKLPLMAWGQADLRRLFRTSVFLRSLGRGKIVPKDFVEPVTRFLGSKTWTDHLRMKEAAGAAVR